ncbi:MAG: hypothetical protein AAGC55_05895 [Myxococcota bacterium]
MIVFVVVMMLMVMVTAVVVRAAIALFGLSRVLVKSRLPLIAQREAETALKATLGAQRQLVKAVSQTDKVGHNEAAEVSDSRVLPADSVDKKSRSGTGHS